LNFLPSPGIHPPFQVVLSLTFSSPSPNLPPLLGSCFSTRFKRRFFGNDWPPSTSSSVPSDLSPFFYCQPSPFFFFLNRNWFLSSGHPSIFCFISSLKIRPTSPSLGTFPSLILLIVPYSAKFVTVFPRFPFCSLLPPLPPEIQGTCSEPPYFVLDDSVSYSLAHFRLVILKP